MVDDEPDILESLAALFARDSPGWNVLTTTSPREALGRLDDVDLVMADHRMPGMTGVELLAEVRRAKPDAVRVLVTAYSDLDIAIAALERAEVHYYLRKPWEPREMHAVLEGAMRSTEAKGPTGSGGQAIRNDVHGRGL